MAKSKEQKREEALRRAHQRLLTHVIPNWIASNNPHTPSSIPGHAEYYEEELIRSAYAAHCDRYGNFLDYRFYHHRFHSGEGYYGQMSELTPFECAMRFKLCTLEEMKNLYESSPTLYDVAYGKMVVWPC